MSIENSDLKEYEQCFVCGRDNASGLRMDFEYEGDDAVCRFSLEPRFEGFPGLIHGGIVAAILDEAMAKAILHAGWEAVTARMTTEYRQPLRSGVGYTVRGRVLECRGRRTVAASEIHDASGTVCASAEGIWLEKRLTGSESSS
jgi:uncharacterized protein (TIGR00369 family)